MLDRRLRDRTVARRLDLDLDLDLGLDLERMLRLLPEAEQGDALRGLMAIRWLGQAGPASKQYLGTILKSFLTG